MKTAASNNRSANAGSVGSYDQSVGVKPVGDGRDLGALTLGIGDAFQVRRVFQLLSDIGSENRRMQVQHTAADVKFMQDMIHHHAQALDMTALIPSRTSREDMKLFGLRIEISQKDEIGMMQRWLQVRGQRAPGEHDHHLPGATLMPGMLNAEEMARLAEAKGAEFDRLFLEGMIQHHGGAIIMVDELFASAGAAQDSEIFAFVSDVVADQSAEIERMSAMLAMLKEFQK